MTPTGLRSVRVTARGRGLRLDFARRLRVPVQIDVFQHSSDRRVVGARLVARFTGRSRGLTWNGRANRAGRKVGDGYYVVRYRMALARGAVDTRLVTVRRARGRFAVRPASTLPEGCGLLRTYELARPVFGGRARTALELRYRLDRRARVSVEVRRGNRVVRRVAAATRRAGRTYRLRIAAAPLRAGDYTVRITATEPGRRPLRATVAARRL